MSSHPPDELARAARLQRRWRGLGGVLFMLFYSLFFAAHMKLAATSLYLKDDVFAGTPTASFVNDLTAAGIKAGSGGAGEDSAFLLLHHTPIRLLTAFLKLVSENPTTAGRHAVAALTAGAGALTLGLLYQALLWCGVGRWRAILFSSLAGTSTALMLLSALPQPQVFSVLGLTALLAALVRGRSGRWWEFAAAALYALCCSLLNVIPVCVLALIRGAGQSRSSGSLRPLLSAPVNVAALLLLTFGAIQVQGLVYPRASQAGILDIVQSTAQRLHQTLRRLPEVNWKDTAERTLVASFSTPRFEHAEASGATRTVVLAKTPTLASLSSAPELWVLLLILAAVGLGTAGKTPGALAGIGLLASVVVMDATTAGTMLQNMSALPALVFLAGLGVEQCIRQWKPLRIPVCVLLILLLLALMTHNGRLVAELARMTAI